MKAKHSKATANDATARSFDLAAIEYLNQTVWSLSGPNKSAFLYFLFRFFIKSNQTLQPRPRGACKLFLVALKMPQDGPAENSPDSQL